MREQDREKESARREKRFDCYGQLAVLLSRWFELFVRQGDDFESVSDQFESHLLDFQNEGDRIYGSVRLLGSKQMSEVAFYSIDALRSNNRLYFGGQLREMGKCEDEYNRNLDTVTQAIDYARAELGFAHSE